MKRRFAASIAAWLVTVILLPCGCGPRSSSDKPRVALIMKSLANQFFQTMEKGAVAHNEANPDKYELVTTGIKDERDVAQQTKLVRQMIARKAAAIVIAPADSTTLVSPCREAMDAGVVVVNIDNKLDDAALRDEGISIPFVGPDNCAGAKQVGDYLAQHLKPGDEVIIIEGVTTAFNSQQRRKGFQQSMDEAKMNVVAVECGQWETSKAKSRVAALLPIHPNVRAILCANDKMAVGAVAAVEAIGKDGQEEDDILIVGFDNISDVQEHLKDGTMLATADQHADKLAAYGIEYALEILKSGKAPADKETPVDLITSADVR